MHRQIMKIAVLGATGPSGKQVVLEGLDRGHHITALVRNPDKLTEKHVNLTVKKVDIYNAEDLVQHLRGQDAVLSCLGAPMSWFNLHKVTFYSDTIKPVTAAMTTAGESRFIFMSSWYTKYNQQDPFIINWIAKPLGLDNMLHNMGTMEDFLEGSDANIDFTSVRCAQLTNADSSGKGVKVVEGQSADGVGYTIARRDVAKFMLDIAASGEYKRKCIAIGPT